MTINTIYCQKNVYSKQKPWHVVHNFMNEQYTYFQQKIHS